MNRRMPIARVTIAVTIALASHTWAGESPAFAPGAPIAAYEFCYAFGSAPDGGPTTYYTGVFQANPNDVNEVHKAFRAFLADKYGSQPDPRAGERDMTCVQPSPSSAAAAQQQSDVYAGNMRRGGGNVVETGWQFVAAPAPASAPAKAVTLPDDPRVAGATPEMRGLLEARKGDAGQVCLIDNGKHGPQPLYDCACYADRVVIATLDVGSTVTQASDGNGHLVPRLVPPIELVVPRADLHTCIDQAQLPKRAYDRGMQMTGMYVGDAKTRLAQCIADDTMAAYGTNPGTNIQYFDNLVMNAYGRCAPTIH